MEKDAKKSDRRKLLSNLLSLASVRGLDYLIPLITLPYLVRTLGIDGFGLVNFALSFGLYFSAVMQYGFSVTAVRKIARNREDPRRVAEIYSETLTAVVILVAICAALYLPIIIMVDSLRQHFKLYLYTFFFVAAQSLFPVWFFQGVENMRQSAVISIVSKVMLLGGIFVFVQGHDDYYLVPALSATAMFGCVLFSLYWISNHYRISYMVPRLEQIRSVYWEGRNAFLAQLAPNLYNNSATFLLGVFAGPSAVGVFSAAAKVIDVFNSVGLIVSNAFFPYLARNRTAIPAFQKLMVLAGLLATIICFSFSEIISNILFGTNDSGIAETIRWLAIGVLAYFMILTFNTNYLMLSGKDHVVKFITVGTSAVFFVLGFILIPTYGMFGAVSMLVGARLSMAIAGYCCFRVYKAKV